MKQFELLALVTCISLNATGCATPGAATTQDEAAITRSVHVMTDAFNKRNDATLLAISTPDADYVTVLGRWTRGTAAYVEARRSRFDGPLRNARLRPRGGRAGYVDLEQQIWPHGATGAAWGHAALFLPVK